MSLLRMTGFSAGIAFLLVAFAGVSSAQDEPATPHRGSHGGEHPMLQRADQNGDGIISYDEAVESLPGMTDDRFNHMDGNSDGSLGAEELRAGRGRGQRGPGAGPLRQNFDTAEVDKDGALDREELKAGMPRFPEERFESADVDGDGKLSFEELTQSRVRPRLEGDHHRARAGGAQRLDADGDGEVSLEEFRAVRPDMTEERFAEVDADRSGAVSREELRAVAGDRPTAAERESFIKRIFTERDADGNGTLSAEEANSGRRPMSAERFGRMDVNGDGALTEEEFAAGFGRRGDRESADGHRRPVNEN